MTRIARIVLTSLSLFLGMFFFFFGLIKVSKSLNQEIHREMRRNFVRYVKVLPIFPTYFNWKISPKLYRLTIGYSEIIAGLLLAFCPGFTKQLVNIFLIILTIGAIYTHVKIKDDVNKMIPAIAFCSMLTTRLILYFLLKRIGDEDYDNIGYIEFDDDKPESINRKSKKADEDSNKDAKNHDDDDVVSKSNNVVLNEQKTRKNFWSFWNWWSDGRQTSSSSKSNLIKSNDLKSNKSSFNSKPDSNYTQIINKTNNNNQYNNFNQKSTKSKQKRNKKKKND